MSRDQSSWYPLHHEDPVPGDPVALRDAGEEYHRVAEQIAASADSLRAIAGSAEQRSDAVDEVTSKARRLADQIERAYARYSATGTALVQYAEVLAHAQELSLQAREQAQRAVAVQEAAQEDLWYFQRREHESADEPELARVLGTQVANARASMVRADRELEDARVLLEWARAVRDDAADVARAAIQAVVRADDLHDTVWQDLGGGVHEAGSAVWNGLDEVATALGVLALVLCWVPGLNVALAALATIAGAVVLVRDVVNLATGNGSWAEVGWSALGVVTFGVGRVATKGLRMATDANRAARGVRGARQAEQARRAVDEAVDVAGAPVRAGGVASRAGRRSLPTPVSRGTVDILRSRELWRTLKPSEVARDLGTDLRHGVSRFRTASPSSRRVDPLRSADDVGAIGEQWAKAAERWPRSRYAALLEMRGHHGAARDVEFLARQGELSGSSWTYWTGAVQVSEVVDVGQSVHGVVKP